MAPIQLLAHEVTGDLTTTQSTWDPHVNAVSYQRAKYTSQTSQLDDVLGSSAGDVAERVDRATGPEGSATL